MDKAEYRIKLEQINSLAEAGDFKGAASVADTIDWRHVKSVRTLCMVGEIYEANKRYEDSKRILQYAYKRSSISKTVLYRLAEISIRLGDHDDAKRYYNEFEQLSPNDTSRYILKYKLLRAEGATLDDQIAVLKDYKEREYTERWAYELAKLYMKNGQKQKCVEECDEMILWFADGKYVTRAMELKMQVRALTEPQKKIYEDRQNAAEKENNAKEIMESTMTADSLISKAADNAVDDEEKFEEVEEKKKFSSIDAIRKMEAAADETVSSALSGSRPNVMPGTRQSRDLYRSRTQSLAEQYAEAARAAQVREKAVEQKVTEKSIAASEAAVKEIEAAAEAAVQSIEEKVEAAYDDIGMTPETTAAHETGSIVSASEKTAEAVVEKAIESADEAEEMTADASGEELMAGAQEEANAAAEELAKAVEASEAVEESGAASGELVAIAEEEANAAAEELAEIIEENEAVEAADKAAEEAVEEADVSIEYGTESAEETEEVREETADEILAEETIEVGREIEEILEEEKTEKALREGTEANASVEEEQSVSEATEPSADKEVSDISDAADEALSEAKKNARIIEEIVTEEAREVAKDVEEIMAEENAEVTEKATEVTPESVEIAEEPEEIKEESAEEVEEVEESADEPADETEVEESADEPADEFEEEDAESEEDKDLEEKSEEIDEESEEESEEESDEEPEEESAEESDEEPEEESAEEDEESADEPADASEEDEDLEVESEEDEELVDEFEEEDAEFEEESGEDEGLEEEPDEDEESDEESEEELVDEFEEEDAEFEEESEEDEDLEEESEAIDEESDEEPDEESDEEPDEESDEESEDESDEESQGPTPEEIARSADEEAEKALQEMMASFLNEFAVSGSEYRMTGAVLPEEDDYDYDEEDDLSESDSSEDDPEHMLGKETDESLGLTRTESFQEQLKKALEAGGNFEEARQIVISSEDFMSPEEAAKRTVMTANGLEYDPDAEDEEDGQDIEDGEDVDSRNAEDGEDIDSENEEAGEDQDAEDAEDGSGEDESDDESDDEFEDDSDYESEEVLNELVADEEDLEKRDTSSLTDILTDSEAENLESDSEIVEQIMAEPEILELVDVLPRPFTEEERALFSYFADIPGISEQATLALADIHNHAGDKTSRAGNVLIMGRQVSGKTRLADALIRSVCLDLNIRAIKIAKVIGEDLNGKDPAAIVDQMSGGFLIIEGAGSLNDEFVEGLNKAMEFRTDNLVVILEDEKADMMSMLEKHPEFADKFTSTIIVPVFTNDELVTFARTYAKEMGYKLDEMATLALYTMIGENQKDSEPVVIGKVKKMIDQAIERSKGSKFTALFRKNAAAEDGRIWLREKDFAN